MTGLLVLVANPGDATISAFRLDGDRLERLATTVLPGPSSAFAVDLARDLVYAATKGATELMGHAYAHLFGTPTTFFRFFTVYGPWGRPDMALFKFAQAMRRGEAIEIYGQGQMSRDFTYIDDLVEAIVRLADAPPVIGEPVGPFDTLSPVAPYRLVNIGGGAPSKLMDFVAELERAMGMQAKKTFLPMQDGDVPATWASSELLEALTGYRPSTPISVGVPAFVDWLRGRNDV